MSATRDDHLEVIRLVVPGLDGSGPGHWQSLWADGRPGWRRVEQRSWAAPILEDWVEGLDRAIQRIHAPVILVAHSLGAMLVAHWAARASRGEVLGALLVAPADVERTQHRPGLRAFAPPPGRRLPFPAWVVASTNDPHCTAGRARVLAAEWGARLVSAGAVGHNNGASGHGPWPEGEQLMEEVVARWARERFLRRAG